MVSCYECGRDTILEGYTIRVCNERGDTLFVDPCVVECIKFMEGGGLSSTSCYKLEVMKVGR